MSNVVPIYPNAIFSWIDRVDQVNIDFAGDINSVASDLIAVESTLGANPQVESNPPAGGQPVGYPNVSARISDAASAALMPVCILRSGSFIVDNLSSGALTPFNLIYDPYGMFNGTDITITANGWFLFTVHQTWAWWDDGYSHTYLQTNGNTVEEDLINWEFAGNGKDPSDQSIPRWQKFGKRTRIAHLTWQGRCSPGERISVLAENGTSNTAMQVTYTALHVAMLKKLPSTLAANIQ